MLGGFYVAALVKAGRMSAASTALDALAQLNQYGNDENEDWQFMEWAHGRTGKVRGGSRMPWNAGSYLYAYTCMREGHLPILRDLFDPIEK